MRAFVAIGLVLSGLLLAACDGAKEPSNIVYPDVRAAIEGDPAVFDTYKGETVRWTGQVVEAIRRFGDDYAEEGLLLVDMDAPRDAAGQEPEPDVSLLIPPSRVPELTPGQPVTFVGVIREIQRDGRGGRLLRLELKSLEE
jgi:hypothetical protein